jgi:Fe-S-cluster containining protein
MSNGQCVFLGKDNQCNIYHLRPTQCRTYPFWPELLDKEAHWLAERKFCEGIDRGKVVDTRHIRQQLQQQLDAEEDT